MHNWRLLVQQRLAGLRIEDGEATLVVEELAGHLEENYQSLLRDGLSEDAAALRTLESVNNWQDLKRKLESSRKKETHKSKRVVQFWLPAFVTLLLSLVLLAVIQIFGPDPIISPVFPYVAFFVIGLPIAIMFDDHVSHNVTVPAFFAGLAGWVIFPAAALLAGGLACSAFRFSVAKREGIR